MGWFDFIREAGANILGNDPAEDVREHLNTELSGKIQNLEVGFDDGTITLSGECDTQATKEKATLIAGNIKGVGGVNSDGLTVAAAAESAAPAAAETVEAAEAPAAPAAPEAAPEAAADSGTENQEAEFYTIQSGDSLSKIAKQFYGDPMKYPEIFNANQEVIKDPDKIYPGQVIRIPNLA